MTTRKSSSGRRTPLAAADRRHGARVLLHVPPFTVRVVARPVLGPAVVHGLAEFGSQRDTQVGFLDRLVGRLDVADTRSVTQRRDPRAVLKALGAAGIICDFREPDIIRAAPTALYNRYQDVYDFVETLATHG